MVRKMLTDSQWKRMGPLLPGKVSDCGVTQKVRRGGIVDSPHGFAVA